ncbi:hypothetical protein J2Y63_007049 [Shinella sp. BE166]|uniref:BON domain-containing protein n=1 Tax=Shinella sp. BE166 TaxID=3373918 RepID=UPI003EBBFE54
MADRKQVSREDDFRDFEQRDIRDGWPYADKDADPREVRNAPYGAPDANFDQLDNEGVEVSLDPVATDVSGAPLPFSDGTEDVIADDELEERITLALEGDKQIDLASLEITVRDGEVHIDGSIDSEDDRRHLIGSIRAVAGVRNVHARELLTRGVDSHIPSDSEE